MSAGFREGVQRFDFFSRKASTPVVQIGFIDAIRDRTIAGWVYDSSVDGPCTIEISFRGTSVGHVRADRFRADIRAAGYGDGHAGFSLELDEASWSSVASIFGLSAKVVETGFTLTNAVEMDSRKQVERNQNSVIRGFPDVDLAFSERAPNERDEAIAAEIIDLSSRMSGDALDANSIWGGLSEGHKQFQQLIGARDPKGLAAKLIDLPKLDAGFGYMQGRETYEAFRAADRDGLVMPLTLIKDGLVSIAQYLGLERIECAEQGEFGAAIHFDTDKLVDRISHAVGFDIVPPDVFDGLFGLKVDRGILTDRDVQALYAAHRLVSTAGSGATVCEIGGGVGRAAFYGHRLGARRYTMVDLSSMLVFQYFFLRSALPDATVKMITDPGEPQEADFNLVPAQMFASLGPQWRFDAVLNCDSFPEMGEAVCDGYLSALRARTNALVSINQEARGPLTRDGAGPRQVPVAEVMAKRSDYDRRYRFRTWVRQGYVEELYSPMTATR